MSAAEDKLIEAEEREQKLIEILEAAGFQDPTFSEGRACEAGERHAEQRIFNRMKVWLLLGTPENPEIIYRQEDILRKLIEIINEGTDGK